MDLILSICNIFSGAQMHHLILQEKYFSVEDGDHIDRLISCLSMAIPFFVLPNRERKLDLLKNLAESSPYTTTQDSRQILPSVVQLLKKCMPRRKTEEMNFTYVECLLHTFHNLVSKAPNATYSLCGYKVVTGQPSDRLGEDFSEYHKDFMERLTCAEELSRATMKKLTQGLDEHSKAMAAAVSDEGKERIPLRAKSPSFIGDKRINLSWKEETKPTPSAATGAGAKRPGGTVNGASNNVAKKGRGAGGLSNQLVNRAFGGISYAGRVSGGGRGRGWGGRGRGRGSR
ncbi:hypothetical protein Ancab_005358 [Ancistrocladus abbreviatus]